MIVALLDKKLGKLIVICYVFPFFLEKKVQSDAPLSSSFPRIIKFIEFGQVFEK